MENYVIINGRKYEISGDKTKKISEMLGINFNPLTRAAGGERYFYINDDGFVSSEFDMKESVDNNRYNVANYCTDQDMMMRRAKMEVLNRKMWRFSMDHGGDKIDWNSDDDKKWYLALSFDNEAVIDFSYGYHPCGTVCFISEEVAIKALETFGKEIEELYGDY